MISPWKLIKLAQKWQRVAALRRKRITILRDNGGEQQPSCSGAQCKARKGHFVVYTSDQKRFEILMKYLNSAIVRELFRLSEEEFGLPGDGPITLPIDANSMELIISLISGKEDRDLQKCDLIFSVPANGCSYFPAHARHVGQQLLACS